MKAVLQDTYGSPEVTRMEGSRPLRATALLFANCEAGGLVGAWVAVNSQSDVSAFPRLRARSGRRRGTNRRPRFHATRGLSAAIRPALQLAVRREVARIE